MSTLLLPPQVPQSAIASAAVLAISPAAAFSC
jgi:hypothetical protein